MSAPIAVTALVILPFKIALINPCCVGGCAGGDVGEGEHFPAFRVRSGCGGSAAGRQHRSSTYPQAFLVNLPRRAITEALVLALLVVEAEPGANADLRLCDAGIGVQVDLL